MAFAFSPPLFVLTLQRLRGQIMNVSLIVWDRYKWLTPGATGNRSQQRLVLRTETV
jgi:hypothetical protein